MYTRRAGNDPGRLARPGPRSRLPGRLQGLPANLFEIDPPRAVEPHTLAPEQRALQRIPAGGPPADLSLRVDDTVPGDVVRTCAESPADRAAGPRRPERAGDRSVRGDAARRDPAHDGVHARKGRGTTPGVAARPRTRHGAIHAPLVPNAPLAVDDGPRAADPGLDPRTEGNTPSRHGPTCACPQGSDRAAAISMGAASRLPVAASRPAKGPGPRRFGRVASRPCPAVGDERRVCGPP